MADSQSSKPLPATPALTKGLENVFVSGQFSDLTITCKNRTWKAHKLVVCTQSEFFMKACTDGFKETGQNAIDLPDDDPEVVDTMLYYLYHFDYPDPPAPEDGEATTKLPALLLHLRIFQLADKYLIEPLQSLATEKFNLRANDDWATPSFAEALIELYSQDVSVNAETLRLIVLETVTAHNKALFHSAEHDVFRGMVLQAPEFLMAYSQALTAEAGSKATLPGYSGLTWYRCPGFGCKRYNAVFGVGATVPGRFHMNCPLRCEKDRDMEWWKQYKTTV